MDRPRNWNGARIEWRVRVAGKRCVAFYGQIDTAEDYGDGVVRISGALASGGQFVLVTDETAVLR